MKSRRWAEARAFSRSMLAARFRMSTIRRCSSMGGRGDQSLLHEALRHSLLTCSPGEVALGLIAETLLSDEVKDVLAKDTIKLGRRT